MNRTLFIFAAASLVTACAPSEFEIQLDYDTYLEEHQRCEASDECALVVPGCPLGCYYALSIDSAEEAQQLADELTSYYESYAGSCANECPATPGVACREQRCTPCDPSSGAADCLHR